MAFELRPYQSGAIRAVTEKWETEHAKEALIVIPTGGGKTVIFCQITEEELKKGGRVLILAHRNKLLQQAQDKLSKFGILSDIEKGGKTSDSNVIISTVQTYSKEDRLNKCPADMFSLIIVDECHHAPADTYQKIIRHFTGAKLLGVTATPERSDDGKVEDTFGDPVFQYYFTQAIEEGFLTPITVRQLSLKIDLSDVQIFGKDYSASSLGDCLDDYMEKIASEVEKLTKERNKILIFLPLVALAQKMTNLLKEKDVPCEYVSGDRKESDDILEDFEKGKYKVICNAMLLTEGYDCPSIDCIINLRPTKSSPLYTQIVGRGTRLYPGKKDMLLVDFLWQDNGKGILRADEMLLKEHYDKIAKTPEEKAALKEILSKPVEGDKDLFKIKKDAEAAFVNALAEAKWKKNKAIRDEKQGLEPLGNIKFNYPYQELQNRRVRFYYDPNTLDVNNKPTLLGLEINFFAAIAFGISEYKINYPERSASEKQKALIKELDKGFPVEYVYYSDQASLIINALNKRINRFGGANKATFKQTELLESKGFRGIERIRNFEAKELITMLAKNNYVPTDEMYKEAEKLTNRPQKTLFGPPRAINDPIPELW